MTDAESSANALREPAPSGLAPFRVPARDHVPRHRMADAVRALAADCVASAGSGDLTLAFGMADAATELWTRVLKFDAADPRWPDRDRFVLSAGHGAALLYALLCLTGHAGMDAECLRSFRRLHSPASGHPTHGGHPAIEATTGPHGQGLGIAVGMALAERMLAARFGKSLVDHRTWAIVCAGDLRDGLSHEAVCLAGQLRLEKLTVLYAESPDASGGGTDQARRFMADGWAVKQVDGHDPAQLAAALSAASRSRKPSLIACRTSAADTSRGALGWAEPEFAVPDALAARWRAAGGSGASARRAWIKRLARHPMRAEFERVIAGRLPDTWRETAAAMKSCDALLPDPAAIPELVAYATGCEAGLVTQGSYAGRHVPYLDRAHGMAAAVNGIALHGGLIPCGGTTLARSDALRPALRLAAQMKLRMVHVLTDDSIALGEDGPAHQPVEQLAAWRAMPNVLVLRPADRIEAAEAWDLALRRVDGPSLIVLCAHPLPALARQIESGSARGGYVLAEAIPRQATLIATGAEVHLAMQARAMLADAGIAAAVVSLPAWRLFEQQDAAYRARVLGSAPRFGIEAACGFGWDRWLGPDGVFIGLSGFGASAPASDLFRYFGMTAEAVSGSVMKRLGC